MKASPPEDHAEGIKELDFSGEQEPVQHSLGLWEVASDTLTFSISVKDKPFTHWGVLCIVNSLFDTIGGTFDWNTPLPEVKQQSWESWKDSLQVLSHLHIPCMYTSNSLCETVRKELCVFSDTFIKAIGAVAHIRAIRGDGTSSVGLDFGKTRLTPQSEPTIPCLELCAAVMVVEIADFILSEIDFQPDAVTFYCDNKVVLGYVHNQSRIQRIHQSSKPEQWFYVLSEQNPADMASRSVHASQLLSTIKVRKPHLKHMSLLIHMKMLSRDQGGLFQKSPLFKLQPGIDEAGLIRAGSRLKNAQLDIEVKNPLIPPKNHHLSMLLARHYHKQVKHQGHHFSEGAIRAVSLCIIGGKNSLVPLLTLASPAGNSEAQSWNGRWPTCLLNTRQQHHLLGPRCKWNKQHHNLQKGDIVLLKDSRAPCNEWPMPVVVTSKPSADKEFGVLEIIWVPVFGLDREFFGDGLKRLVVEGGQMVCYVLEDDYNSRLSANTFAKGQSSLISFCPSVTLRCFIKTEVKSK
ncbi:hypothetical protein CCH79_00020587, partial [Gambusia affinis]